ncbi:MAG: glycosyl hydrolase family 18 protein [Peptococcaceae bacterium]|jgi:spore germination protein YaaH|nr:glycosyl hydrolase family 18 protein [Peptococcaceae bacterium]
MAVRKGFLAVVCSLALLVSIFVSPQVSAALAMPQLSLGSRGDAVTELQNLLKTAGYYHGQPSGYFGMTTLAALTGFQTAHHLTVSGVAGQTVWDSLSGPSTTAGGQKIVLGYYVNDFPGDNGSYNSVLKYGGDVNYTATVSYQVNSDGGLSGQVPLQGLTMIKQSGSTPLLLINNIGANGDNPWSVHAMLASRQATQSFYSNVLYLVGHYGYKGVNIDFEGLWPQDRNAFSRFLAGLKAQLAPHGYLLSVSVPAETSDQPNDTWSGAYDYSAIGQSANLVALMTYDEHWSGGDPGPVAALPWVESVLSYATSVIPPNKILMGIAAYGYNWSPNGTSVVEWNQNGQLAQDGRIGWNNASDSPYLYYYAGGVEHVVWFENKQSLAMKLQLVKQYGIAGIAFWRLGYENSSFWSEVDSYLR